MIKNKKKRKNLTERELQVIKYMSIGYNNQEIADALHYSVGNINHATYFIMHKLNVNNRTKAVVKWLKEYVDIDIYDILFHR